MDGTAVRGVGALRVAHAHASTYIRTRADHDIAGLDMHVRLAYCLAPMHAWLSWDELPFA